MGDDNAAARAAPSRACRQFDIAALAGHLVERDSGGALTLATLDRLAPDATLFYYARAYAIVAAARDQPRQ